MSSVNNLAALFPKELFWDVNVSQLDIQDDKDLIIPRLLYATTENTFSEDISRLERFYTRTEIVENLNLRKNGLVIRFVQW